MAIREDQGTAATSQRESMEGGYESAKRATRSAGPISSRSHRCDVGCNCGRIFVSCGSTFGTLRIQDMGASPRYCLRWHHCGLAHLPLRTQTLEIPKRQVESNRVNESSCSQCSQRYCHFRLCSRIL